MESDDGEPEKTNRYRRGDGMKEPRPPFKERLYILLEDPAFASFPTRLHENFFLLKLRFPIMKSA